MTKLLRWRGVGMADNVEEKEEEDFVPDDGGLLCDQHNTQIEEEVCEFESDNGGNADIRGEAIERDVRLQKRKEMKEQQRKQRADQQVRRDARQRYHGYPMSEAKPLQSRQNHERACDCAALPAHMTMNLALL